MKVAQVISSMAQESSGVQSYLASMCNALVDSGVETSLYTCGETRDLTRRYQLKTFRRGRFPMYPLARSRGCMQRLMHPEVWAERIEWAIKSCV